MRSVIRAIASVGLLFAGVSLHAQTTSQPFDVKWSGELLTIHASNAPLVDVMNEIVRATGIRVIGSDKLTGPVSANIVDQPLVRAMSSLLTGVNYVVQETANPGGGPAKLTFRVHSMAGGDTPNSALTGPLQIREIDAIVTNELSDLDDEKEIESDPADPDSADEHADEVHQGAMDVSRLEAQGAFTPAATTESLIKLIDTSYSTSVVVEAVKALGTRPIKATLPTLLKQLGGDEWEIRTAAVDILGRATDHESLQKVGELIQKDDDRDTQISALRVLALRGEPESAVYLRRLPKGTSEDISDAAQALAAELDRRQRAREANAR